MPAQLRPVFSVYNSEDDDGSAKPLTSEMLTSTVQGFHVEPGGQVDGGSMAGSQLKDKTPPTKSIRRIKHNESSASLFVALLNSVRPARGGRSPYTHSSSLRTPRRSRRRSRSEQSGQCGAPKKRFPNATRRSRDHTGTRTAAKIEGRSHLTKKCLF